MQPHDDQYHSTTDLCLACTLSLFFPIKEITKDHSGRARFYFPSSPDLKTHIALYWDNSISVEPKQFFAQLKTIKQRIYGSG